MSNQRLSSWLGILILLLIILVLPLFVQNVYYLGTLVIIGIKTIVVVGLCLLMGYTGQVSLGHAAFFGLGAYLTGVLTSTYSLAPWLVIVLAALVTGMLAYLLGIPTLRLREHYLALATLGLGLIIYFIFNEMTGITGGPSGLTGIPYFKLGSFVFYSEKSMYYLVWAVTLLAIVLASNILQSRVGRAWRAIHSSEIAAESVGIDTARYKVRVFVLSAVYASIAGSLYAHYATFISPGTFGFQASVEFVLMAVMGGLASVWGPLAGVTAVVLLAEFLRNAFHGGSEYEIIIFGLILVVVMIFLPEGLTAGLRNIWERKKYLNNFSLNKLNKTI